MPRIAIVAPEYVLDYGHVGKGLVTFSKFLSAKGHEVSVFVPSNSPKGHIFPRRVSVKRVLPDIYQAGLAPPGFNPEKLSKGRVLIQRALIASNRIIPNNVKRVARRLAWLAKAHIQLEKFLKVPEHANFLANSDYLFFPNADYLTLKVFVRRFASRRAKVGPRIIPRFINVLENHGFPMFMSTSSLFKMLARVRRRTNQVFACAETEEYAAHIRLFGLPTEVMHYPPASQASNTGNTAPPSTQIIIGALGSARPDKGFEHLPMVIERFFSLQKLPSATFVVQAPNVHWSDDSRRVELSLLKMPNVVYLEGVLDQETLDKHMDTITINLLAYSETRYALRGSAMLYEACDRLIPSIGPKSSAFGKEIERHRLGLVFSRSEEIPDSLQRLSRSDLSLTKNEISRFNIFRSHSVERMFVQN